jgi:proteasome alpha subunit
MQDKAEYAQKGIAKGRSIIVLEYEHGILFFADNPSASLNKISEVYDRIAFAGAGKYSEFETLRKAGIRHADLKGYAYSREDVTAKSLANAYSQTLGTIFSQEIKPFEVEILVAEINNNPETNEIYRILYDGNISDEKGYTVIGGRSEAIKIFLKERYRSKMTLKDALTLSTEALESAVNMKLPKENMEVAVLDRNRNGRKFKRIKIDELSELLNN